MGFVSNSLMLIRFKADTLSNISTSVIEYWLLHFALMIATKRYVQIAPHRCIFTAFSECHHSVLIASEAGFYLPPIPIKICDAQGIKIKIIGDKCLTLKKWTMGIFEEFERFCNPPCSGNRAPSYVRCLNCDWTASLRPPEKWSLFGRTKHLIKSI